MIKACSSAECCAAISQDNLKSSEDATSRRPSASLCVASSRPVAGLLPNTLPNTIQVRRVMIRSIDHVLEVKRDGVVEVAIVGDAGIPN